MHLRVRGLFVVRRSSQEAQFEAIDGCIRCCRIAESFFGSTLESIVSKLEDKDQGQATKASWSQADETLTKLEKGGVVKWAREKRVHFRRRVGFRMEARYGFMTVSEFEKRTGSDAKKMNYKVISLENEEGTKDVSGILFKICPGDNSDRYRVVVFFSERAWFLDEAFLKAQESTPQDKPSACYLGIFRHLSTLFQIPGPPGLLPIVRTIHIRIRSRDLPLQHSTLRAGKQGPN